MDLGTCHDICHSKGFRLIGSLHDGSNIEVWWHDAHALELLVWSHDDRLVLRGAKPYTVKSISRDGSTFVRDVNQFCAYLESHFAEMHLSISHFRDISGTLAEQHVKTKAAIDAPTRSQPKDDQGQQLDRAIDSAKSRLGNIKTANQHLRSVDGFLQSHLAAGERVARAELKRFERERTTLQGKLDFMAKLQRGYLDRSSAALVSFAIHSNLQIVAATTDLRVAAGQVVTELLDLDRYQIRQKLTGGKLQIQVEASRHPLMHWIEQRLGGALSPIQMERMQDAVPDEFTRSSSRYMVTPKSDVTVDASTREHAKPIAQRAMESVLFHVDRTEDLRAAKPKASQIPLTIGRIIRNGATTNEPFYLSLDLCIHIYASGTTGSGKSYLGRVIIEEAAKFDDLDILILDPRNQSAGLLVPEDRQEVFDRYGDFGMGEGDAQAYLFKYAAPNLNLPGADQIKNLVEGRQIVSFKGMSDVDRCRLFADLLQRVFEKHNTSESTGPRMLIVVEEAHRFTKRRVDDAAKAEAARAEMTLDMIAREGRKFGICLLILSQAIRDFAYDSASIRSNTPTKVFMHNSDREVEYANDFIDRGKDIVQLAPATAIIHNPHLGEVTIAVRPPYSKVWEFSLEETRALVLSGQQIAANRISDEAQTLLADLQQAETAGLLPIRVGELVEFTGITSKRRLNDLLTELEAGGLISSTMLAQRGQPRVISLNSSGQADEFRTESDENGGGR